MVFFFRDLATFREKKLEKTVNRVKKKLALREITKRKIENREKIAKTNLGLFAILEMIVSKQTETYKFSKSVGFSPRFARRELHIKM